MERLLVRGKYPGLLSSPKKPLGRAMERMARELESPDTRDSALDSPYAATYTWSSLPISFSIGFIVLCSLTWGVELLEVHFVAVLCHYIVVENTTRKGINHGY
jgi:hypothetical protein